MAQVYHSINRGKNFETVVIQTSTVSGADVEVRVNTGTVLAREELLEALGHIELAIVQNVYPFA